MEIGPKRTDEHHCFMLFFKQFFKANSDENTPVTNMFQCPVIAKCIRINPLDWKNQIAMRLDLIGCSLGMILLFSLIEQVSMARNCHNHSLVTNPRDSKE